MYQPGEGFYCGFTPCTTLQAIKAAGILLLQREIPEEVNVEAAKVEA